MPIRKLSRLLNSRRKAPRHNAEHQVSLVAGVAVGEGSRAELITGRTRDISATGLSLVLPIEDELQRQRTAVGESARILLVLPTKTVHIHGKVVRSLPFDNKGQLVGVQIVKIDTDDEAIYTEYLSSLK
jgi:hypothetical protein